jgi:CRISPR-associated protein Cas5d
MTPRDQAIEVWGDFACFTRPELKVERFSYPVPTPSAVRGIFDAIYCKPSEFRWQVTSIEILHPLSFIALRRNEVKEKISVAAVQAWMSGKEKPEPLMADATQEATGTDQKGRTQRQTMALRDVRYRLHAELRPWLGFEERQQAFESQFRRRAANGKCVWQPCFGCREFPAFFELLEPGAAGPPPFPLDLDLGLMLYDVFDLSRPGTATSPPSISLFRASVVGGVVEVPDYASDRVLKGEGG